MGCIHWCPQETMALLAILTGIRYLPAWVKMMWSRRHRHQVPTTCVHPPGHNHERGGEVLHYRASLASRRPCGHETGGGSTSIESAVTCEDCKRELGGVQRQKWIKS